MSRLQSIVAVCVFVCMPCIVLFAYGRNARLMDPKAVQEAVMTALFVFQLALMIWIVKLAVDLAPATSKVLALFRERIFPPKYPKRSAEDDELVAYHEAGHTIVARYSPCLMPVKSVSIIEKGTTGGSMKLCTGSKTQYPTAAYYEEDLAMTFGGRAAEEIFRGKPSRGAIRDIETATESAKHMVVELGMGEKIGIMRIDYENCSGELTARVEEAVARITELAYIRAKELLKQHWLEVETLARALLELKRLSGEQVDMILAPLSTA